MNPQGDEAGGEVDPRSRGLTPSGSSIPHDRKSTTGLTQYAGVVPHDSHTERTREEAELEHERRELERGRAELDVDRRKMHFEAERDRERILESVERDRLLMHIESLESRAGEASVVGLPSPGVIREYQEIQEDFADRLMRMAEKEQYHRHSVESAEAQEPFRLARRGQVMAISAVALVLAFSALLAFLGSPAIAGIVAGLDLVGLVVVFITGQQASGRAAEIEDGQERGAVTQKGEARALEWRTEQSQDDVREPDA